MPSTISDPRLKCPLIDKSAEKHQEVSSDESSQSSEEKQPSKCQGQDKNPFLSALRSTRDEKVAAQDSQDENNQDWQVIQCSARYPLWDYRRTQRTELGLSDAPFNIENEGKVSLGIMNKFQGAFSNAQLPPEAVFDVSLHQVKLADLEQGQTCIHLKLMNSRKNVGTRILTFLCDFLRKVLHSELKAL